MEKIENELKYNAFVNNDNMAVEIIKDYMKTNKRLWISNIVLLAIMVCMIGFYTYDNMTYEREIVTTGETKTETVTETQNVDAGGDFTQYQDSATHNDGGE